MRIIRNYDVSSYYPHLMTLCGYTSRNIPSPEVFSRVLDRRMAAKASGDKATANALKLVVNTTYGAMLNQYNDLYDPLMGRSVCITGQLFLLELAEHLYRAVEGLRIVQCNTDGIMVEFDDAQYDEVRAITGEWQERTGFTLEEDAIRKIVQKDANNYVEVQADGTAKIKGGYLVRGVSAAGAFNINNNARVVALAIREYFVRGTPVEDTVNADGDIFNFQLIAKAGSKYRESYQLVDGERVPVQKCNRVYATADARRGTLYKVKAEDGQVAKIENLPEHCVIDNDNSLTLADVDRQWYIDVAKKRINDFLGVKPEKTTRRKSRMANTTTAAKKTEAAPKPNIYERLMAVRDEFADIGIEKNGKNMQLTSKFFTLDDIVNTARPIFHKHKLLPLDCFTRDDALLYIVDVTEPEKMITFTIPMREYMGNAAVTPVQAMGATVTYYRRYLYSLALDLAEKDELEEGFSRAPAPAAKAPATPAQREDVKKSLTDPEGPATDLQVRQLKDALKKLKAAHPEKEEMIADIVVRTVGFTKITKIQCENILAGVAKLLEGEDESA